MLVLGAVSLKLLIGKLANKLVHFILRKELLNFTETAPWSSRTQINLMYMQLIATLWKQ